LAHHNRDRKKVFAPWWKELNGKRFATNDEEESMIFSTIKCIHQLFEKRFQKESDEVWQEYNKEIDEYEKYIMKTQNIESYEDIVPTIFEVQKRMKERDFSFTIMSKK
jgi:aromatic ring-opening dioxygenase catalytic subunit (LigB family)